MPEIAKAGFGTMKIDLLAWWPVIAAVAAGIWWAGVTDTKIAALQDYITATAQHVNNVDASASNTR